LSNTIDLESTLIRAEALFRKFQRLVEAIDKKQNFPAPRPAGSDSPTSAKPLPARSSPSSGSAPTPGNNNTPAASANKGKATDKPQQKVITPELRKLLSRKVEVLPRKTVAQKGDGMPAK